MGIRRRIVLLAGLAVTLAVVGAAVGSYLAVRAELLGQIDESLAAQAEGVRGFAEIDGPKANRLPSRLPGAPDAAPPAADQGVRIQRINAQGEVMRFPRTEALPVSEADRTLAAEGSGRLRRQVAIEGENFRVLTVGVGEDGAFMLGRSLAGVERVLDHLRLILLLIAGAGVALAVALAFAIGRRIVAPIKELTETAEHITATNDLARRIEVDGNDEVARLASRFNAMLETIALHQKALGDSVNSQRQLVADASHELRTPVSAIRTDIEAVLAHPDLAVQERVKILASADERIEELTELILDLIELARGDEVVDSADEVRLDQVVGESIERLRRLAPTRAIEAKLAATVVSGRPDRLFRAVNNLLDNAHKYSPPTQPIEVIVSAGSVEVRDHGPGISDADLPRLFDRFWRGSASRHRAGSGLGLAIVRQVAQAGGGTVTVTNMASGGARFRLAFPILEPAPGAEQEPLARV